jgi:hypothetical protein
MTGTSLIQERFVKRFAFQLEPDAIAVIEQDGPTKRSYRVPFESLDPAPVDVTIWSKPRLWATGVFLALSVLMLVVQLQGGDVESGAALFYASCAALATVLFLRSRQSYVVLKGTPGLVLMKDRPTAQAMTAFIATVQERRRQYLAEHYLLGTHEGALIDALHKLEMLRKEGTVSDAEFEILKADIVGRAQSSRPPQSSPN